MSEYNDRKLVAGELVGYRLFGIGMQEKFNETLYGPYTGITWLPGVNEATCIRLEVIMLNLQERKTETRKHCLGAVGKNCTCGFYARTGNIPAHWKGISLHKNHILAAIHGWGKAMVGTEGFRCKYAEVLGLCHLFNIEGDNRLERLVEKYQVKPYATVADLMQAHPATPMVNDD